MCDRGRGQGADGGVSRWDGSESVTGGVNGEIFQKELKSFRELLIK